MNPKKEVSVQCDKCGNEIKLEYGCAPRSRIEALEMWLEEYQGQDIHGKVKEIHSEWKKLNQETTTK